MSNIWVTSDLHFCHDRDFLYAPRGFSSVEEMNQAIVYNWNHTVEHDDTIYVLGDLMLNDDTRGLQLIKSLKGNIHVILGNHDTDTRVAEYSTCYNIMSVNFAARIRVGKYHFFLTHYPTLCGNKDSDKPLDRQVINLCGHSHTNNRFVDMDKGVIYHCELDAHCNKPVLVDSIAPDILLYMQSMKEWHK